MIEHVGNLIHQSERSICYRARVAADLAGRAAAHAGNAAPGAVIPALLNSADQVAIAAALGGAA